MPDAAPRIALAVPNLNQGRFLDAALDSLRDSDAPVTAAVLDAGSTDDSIAILERRAGELAFWRSHRDDGQAAAVNEGVARLCRDAPSVVAVGWLNADDYFLPGGLRALLDALEQHSDWVAVSGAAVVSDERGVTVGPHPTLPFDRERFQIACTICQPATLVRREAWERAGGLDASLDMCFDYDLWWRLASLGPIGYIDRPVAATRDHGDTKTRQRRRRYFEEARAIVRRETGRVPFHWFISEAMEQRVDYQVGRRPGLPDRVIAGASAALAYWRDRAGA
jgi:GT2 family glycosyltransferase